MAMVQQKPSVMQIRINSRPQKMDGKKKVFGLNYGQLISWGNILGLLQLFKYR